MVSSRLTSKNICAHADKFPPRVQGGSLYFLDLVLCLQDGLVNNPEFRRIPLGASHAFGTARDFAKLYGVLSSGGKYNSRLVCILIGTQR